MAIIKPMNDSVIGEPIVHDQSPLLEELEALTANVNVPGMEHEFDTARRQMEATLAPQKQPFQVTVVACGPDCKELVPGDIAFLPQGGGTLVTIHDEDDGSFQRLFMISESAVLARFRAED